MLKPYETARQALSVMGTEEIRPPLLLTGGDLIQAGYTPGPRFREMLTMAEDAQLEGIIGSREEALALRNRGAAQMHAQVNDLVIETLTEGVLVIDRDGRVHAANPAADAILGLGLSTLTLPFALAAGRLAFCGGFDLGDPEVLAEAAAAAGVPLDECLAAAGDASRDEHLAAAGRRLHEMGARELPVLRVGRRLFSGEGRLPEAIAAAGASA